MLRMFAAEWPPVWRENSCSFGLLCVFFVNVFHFVCMHICVSAWVGCGFFGFSSDHFFETVVITLWSRLPLRGVG